MLRKHQYWLGLFWLVVIFVLPAPLIITAAQGLKGTINASAIFGTQVGTVAYVWMLLVIALSEKPRWLDRLIGLPEMYFLHGIVGTLAIVLAFFHSELLPSSGLISLTGNTALYLLIAVLLYSIFFMSSWLTRLSPAVSALKQRLERIFSYETSVWLHLLNIVATLLVFGHVILIPYIRALPAYMFWFYLYSGLTAAVYIAYRLIKPLAFIRGRVVANNQLANDVTELVIKLRRPADFRPGDFAFISFPEYTGMREAHPFSVLQYNPKAKSLHFAIRNYADFTQKIKQVKLRSRVMVDGSYGRLYESLQEHEGQPLVFIGSGIGSVPLIALVLHFVGARDIFFVRVAHEANDLIYDDFLQDLSRQHRNFHYLSQVGRLSEHQIEQIANEGSFYLVGGSSQMITGTTRQLRKQGVKPGNIYSEKFSF